MQLLRSKYFIGTCCSDCVTSLHSGSEIVQTSKAFESLRLHDVPAHDFIARRAAVMVASAMSDAGMASTLLRMQATWISCLTTPWQHLSAGGAACCRATKEEVKQVTDKVKPPPQNPTKTPEP